MEKSVKGKSGSGTLFDYLGNKVIAAWDYIIKVNWGLVVKIHYDEVIAKLNILFGITLTALFFSILTLGLLLTFYLEDTLRLIETGTGVQNLKEKLTKPQTIRYFLWLLFTLSLILTLLGIFNWKQKNNLKLQSLKATSIEKSRLAAQKINQKFNIIKRAADALSHDLSTGRLKKADIATRAKRDMKENQFIWSITIAHKAKHNQDEETLSMLNFERTKKGLIKQEKILADAPTQKKKWYTKGLKGPSWSDPEYDHESDLLIACYTQPFFAQNKDPIGVISVTIAINFAFEQKSITQIVNELLFGRSAYLLLFSQNGTLVHHPIAQNVAEKKTIYDVARQQGIPEIETIAHATLKGKSGIEKIYSNHENQYLWIAYEPITIAQWGVGVVFDESETKLPTPDKRFYFSFILLSVIFALFTLSLLIFHIETPSLDTLVHLSILSTAILSVAFIAFWYFLLITPVVTKTRGIPIDNEINLQNYIDDAQKIAQELQEQPPIIIPTGIHVFNLHFPNEHVEFTSYIWQTFGPQHKNITREIIIPQATDVTIIPVLEQEEGEQQIVVWKVSARLPRKHDYTRFPYDSATISIPIESREITKNILLVPDFKTHAGLPSPLPGFAKEFTIPGFNITKSYFSIETVKPIVSVEDQTIKKISEVHRLDFNIILLRNILNPLIVYLLPLLVILFSLFAVYFMCTKLNLRDPNTNRTIFSALGSYSGLFFALIMLHRTLRGAHPTGAILFIEYLFLFTYVTIVLLFFHGLLMYVKPFTHRMINTISETVKLLFWPIQILLWLLASIWVFI